MHQEIQLNIIPLTAPVEEAEFAFYTAKKDVCLSDRPGYCTNHKQDLNGALEYLVDKRKPALINQHIQQVYEFSRMYWKTVSQQNLPITKKYPKMVKEIYPYFQHNKISLFGPESL
ncbi:MAG: hypothetical protein IPJ86_08105 [Bacteroidetes bacterium]|nr:hypothetical protein [Bacteroidota bacterium]